MDWLGRCLASWAVALARLAGPPGRMLAWGGPRAGGSLAAYRWRSIRRGSYWIVAGLCEVTDLHTPIKKGPVGVLGLDLIREFV
jgi:hypothetical protein